MEYRETQAYIGRFGQDDTIEAKPAAWNPPKFYVDTGTADIKLIGYTPPINPGVPFGAGAASSTLSYTAGTAYDSPVILGYTNATQAYALDWFGLGSYDSYLFIGWVKISTDNVVLKCDRSMQAEYIPGVLAGSGNVTIDGTTLHFQNGLYTHDT